VIFSTIIILTKAETKPLSRNAAHFASGGRAFGPPVGGAGRSVEGPEAPRTGRPEACPTFDAQNENCWPLSRWPCQPDAGVLGYTNVRFLKQQAAERV